MQTTFAGQCLTGTRSASLVSQSKGVFCHRLGPRPHEAAASRHGMSLLSCICLLYRCNISFGGSYSTSVLCCKFPLGASFNSKIWSVKDSSQGALGAPFVQGLASSLDPGSVYMLIQHQCVMQSNDMTALQCIAEHPHTASLIF